ncbi:MAG TPA: hypothetical protein PKW35_18355 [Nannocystaceae bacterium]|nr:hypothetical protein [Nannocystaceae bacterium]
MASWAEIRSYASASYELAEDDEEGLRLVWLFANGRRQQIAVRPFIALEREWCDFVSPICRRPALPPEIAVKLSRRFAVGAICLDDEVFVLRYTAPTSCLDTTTFDLLLQVLAATADELEADFAAADDF